MHHTLSHTPPSITARRAPSAHMAHMAHMEGNQQLHSSMIVPMLPTAGDHAHSRPQPDEMLLFSAQPDSSEMSEQKFNKSSHILRQPCAACLSLKMTLPFVKVQPRPHQSRLTSGALVDVVGEIRLPRWPTMISLPDSRLLAA